MTQRRLPLRPGGRQCHHRPVRILHLVGRSHRRGAEQVAIELAEELTPRGHANRLRAVSLGHEGDRVADLDPLVATSDQAIGSLLRAALRLRADLAAAPVDVVLAHGAAATLVAVLASPRHGPAIVWQRILGLTPRSSRGLLGVWWRLAVRRVDGVVALTDDLGAEVRRLGYRGPIWRIPNGRRVARFAGLDRGRAGSRLRAELGVAAGTVLIGLVGYLVEQKQPVQAIDVVAALRRAEVDVHLVVAGSGPLANEVARAVRRHGLTDCVSLLGHRDDVAAILSGLDVVVLTSADEGIPGVVVEAAMAGCPVVTYPLGGVAEVVEDGVTGLVMGSASAAEMTEAVAGLVRDPVRREAMSTAAVRGASAFSLEVIASRYETHLAEVAR